MPAILMYLNQFVSGGVALFRNEIKQAVLVILFPPFMYYDVTSES